MLSMETGMPTDQSEMPTGSTAITNGIMSTSSSDGSTYGTSVVSTYGTPDGSTYGTLDASGGDTSTNDDRMPPGSQTDMSSDTNDMTISTMNAMSTNPSFSDKPQQTENTQNTHEANPTATLPNGSTMPTMYSTNNGDGTKVPTNRPTMMTTINTMMDGGFPSTATTYVGTSGTDVSTNEINFKPPTYPSIYVSDTKPDDLNYPYPPHNKYNFYHDVYPVYMYPSYYDNDYSHGYAPNTPTVGYPIDPYGTPQTVNRFGGNGPTSSTGAGGGGIGNNRPNTGPAYMGNGWSNADAANHHKPQGYPHRDNSGTYPEGKYNGTRAPGTIPHIRTYFNPDFYLKDAKSE